MDIHDDAKSKSTTLQKDSEDPVKTNQIPRELQKLLDHIESLEEGCLNDDEDDDFVEAEDKSYGNRTYNFVISN